MVLEVLIVARNLVLLPATMKRRQSCVLRTLHSHPVAQRNTFKLLLVLKALNDLLHNYISDLLLYYECQNH